MEIIKRVSNFITSHQMINNGEKVLVAVSGGADSVVLLHILYSLRQQLNISLHVAHLDHMFRGEESREDANFVKLLCQSWQLPHTIVAKDVALYQEQRGLSSQVAAREVRYNLLNEVAETHGASRIALAHHADDQAETVLINLIRGAGPGGLAGISPVRDNLYIRPLLEIRRRQIERYCQQNALQYRTDSSNLKTIYLRNKIRMHLLSKLEEEYNSEIVPALGRMADLCRVDDSYLEQQANEKWLSLQPLINEKSVVFIKQKFEQLHLSMQRRVIRLAWEKMIGEQKNLSRYHVDSIIEQCGSSRAVVELPGGNQCLILRNKIQLGARPEEKKVPTYCYPLKIPGKTIIKETGLMIEAKTYSITELEKSPAKIPENEVVLDHDVVGREVYVRKRLPGDTFKPQGLGGTVKLKKFLIDQKVPREKRDLIPIICNDKEIIWVSGLRVGEYWKVTESTKKILHLLVQKIR
ncbi:MAG: tRNA lysidine(34) synthetase TilS [Firmicutes bacterium]|nr:tRNA lysidine(34) synthetase TilS [Bacillota bacterium]